MQTGSNRVSAGNPSLGDARDIVESVQTVYLRDVAPNVIEHAGRFDGKYRAPVSLSTHVINAAFVGLDAYAYDTLVRNPDEYDEDHVRVLMAALTLHDVNKFIGQRDGESAPANTAAVLERYVEDDPFGVELLLPGTLDEHFDDLLYLIQRTETGEDASESRGMRTEYRGLEVYCELGDAVASAIAMNGVSAGAERLRRHYAADDDPPVRTVNVTEIEQPLLHSEVLDAVKVVLKGGDAPAGLVIGSTNTDVLYLGEPVDRDELRSAVTSRVKETIPEEYDFTGKVGWNSFDYEILSDVDLDIEAKRDTIARQYCEDVLKAGQGLDEPVEAFPDGFEDCVPELVRCAYVERSFETDALSELWEEVVDEVGGQKAKVYFMARLAAAFEQYEDAVREEVEAARDGLVEDLTPEESVIDAIVDRAFSNPALVSDDVGSSDSTCFLCGHEAEQAFQPGMSALYQSMGFSKRVGFDQESKRICTACGLEYALFEDTCDGFDNVYLGSQDVLTARFYFDDFVPDIHLQSSLSGSLIDGETVDFDDVDIAAGLLGQQAHIQPFSFGSKNRKLYVIKSILERLRETGMRATVSQPLANVALDDAVFLDTEPVIEQGTLHATRVDSYEGLERPIALMDLLGKMAGASSRGNEDAYIMLDDDSLRSILSEAARCFDSPGRVDALSEYVAEYHHDEYTMMKNIAQVGIDLYGKQYGSKHAKTSVFRIALDATLNGLNNGMSGDELTEFVAGQVFSRAQNQQYAGHVTTEQAEAFAEVVLEYLDEQDCLSLKRLSDWQNSLIDTYQFAYEQALDDIDN